MGDERVNRLIVGGSEPERLGQQLVGMTPRGWIMGPRIDDDFFQVQALRQRSEARGHRLRGSEKGLAAERVDPRALRFGVRMGCGLLGEWMALCSRFQFSVFCFQLKRGRVGSPQLKTGREATLKTENYPKEGMP